MTVDSDSKLYTTPVEDDIPFAEALPLNDPRSGAGPTKAYPIGLKNYRDDDLEANYVIKEATVLENLGWDRETRKIFIRKVYSILAFQLLLTFCVSAFMTLHAPTQVYVLSHGWPVMLSMVSSFILIFALMCYKDQEPTNMYLLWAFTFAEAFLVGNVVTIYCNEGYQGIVLEAVFLTMAIFIGLTLFTFQESPRQCCFII
jgi:FtsH-binding integral membrane protein